METLSQAQQQTQQLLKKREISPVGFFIRMVLLFGTLVFSIVLLSIGTLTLFHFLLTREFTPQKAVARFPLLMNYTQGCPVGKTNLKLDDVLQLTQSQYVKKQKVNFILNVGLSDIEDQLQFLYVKSTLYDKDHTLFYVTTKPLLMQKRTTVYRVLRELIQAPFIFLLGMEWTSRSKKVNILPDFEVEFLRDEGRLNIDYITIEVCSFQKSNEIPPMVTQAELILMSKMGNLQQLLYYVRAPPMLRLVFAFVGVMLTIFGSSAFVLSVVVGLQVLYQYLVRQYVPRTQIEAELGLDDFDMDGTDGGDAGGEGEGKETINKQTGGRNDFYGGTSKSSQYQQETSGESDGTRALPYAARSQPTQVFRQYKQKDNNLTRQNQALLKQRQDNNYRATKDLRNQRVKVYYISRPRVIRRRKIVRVEDKLLCRQLYRQDIQSLQQMVVKESNSKQNDKQGVCSTQKGLKELQQVEDFHQVISVIKQVFDDYVSLKEGHKDQIKAQHNLQDELTSDSHSSSKSNENETNAYEKENSYQKSIRALYQQRLHSNEKYDIFNNFLQSVGTQPNKIFDLAKTKELGTVLQTFEPENEMLPSKETSNNYYSVSQTGISYPQAVIVKDFSLDKFVSSETLLNMVQESQATEDTIKSEVQPLVGLQKMVSDSLSYGGTSSSSHNSQTCQQQLNLNKFERNGSSTGQLSRQCSKLKIIQDLAEAKRHQDPGNVDIQKNFINRGITELQA